NNDERTHHQATARARAPPDNPCTRRRRRGVCVPFMWELSANAIRSCVFWRKKAHECRRLDESAETLVGRFTCYAAARHVRTALQDRFRLSAARGSTKGY